MAIVAWLNFVRAQSILKLKIWELSNSERISTPNSCRAVPQEVGWSSNPFYGTLKTNETGRLFAAQTPNAERVEHNSFILRQNCPPMIHTFTQSKNLTECMLGIQNSLTSKLGSATQTESSLNPQVMVSQSEILG